MNTERGLRIKRPLMLALWFALSLTVSLVGCSQNSKLASSPETPVITPSGPEIEAVPGKVMTFRASAARADRYEWKLEGSGKISTTTEPVVVYTPPSSEGGADTLTVTAYNAQGPSPNAQLLIRVPQVVSLGLDAVAIPAGWMSGGGDPKQYISFGAGGTGCAGRPNCIRIIYKAGGQWGGVFWWPLNCGDSGIDAAWQKVKAGTCGINVLESGNFREINRLSFWVRGERGGEGVEFKIGAIDISPKPGRSMGKVALRNTWEQKQIDLKGVDLRNAIGLFAWIATDVANPHGATFYLDSIQFEGVR